MATLKALGNPASDSGPIVGFGILLASIRRFADAPEAGRV